RNSQTIRWHWLSANAIYDQAIRDQRLLTRAIQNEAVRRGAIIAGYGHHQWITGHRDRLVGPVVHAFAAVGEILVGCINENHILHRAAIARLPVVINAVPAEESASFGIEVVSIKPSLFGLGIILTALGVQVFAVVALDIGRPIKVRNLRARIIAHGV